MWHAVTRSIRNIDHRAVMAWEQLAALSSLFAHLVQFDMVAMNPVRDVERPVMNRREEMTLACSQKQARAMLDTPHEDKVIGLRDRAILSVGLQGGFRINGIEDGDFVPKPPKMCGAALPPLGLDTSHKPG